jgi:sigma54-dependent transcription regulator
VKGAFTGAHADKVGRFLAANGGTIFLDEINSASPAMQLKLLRVLQERKFEPVGSTQTVEVDVRVVLASNQPLEQLVASGPVPPGPVLPHQRRQDRASAAPRPRGDIPVLAEHFLEKHAGELGKQLVGFTPEAMDALRRYPTRATSASCRTSSSVPLCCAVGRRWASRISDFGLHESRLLRHPSKSRRAHRCAPSVYLTRLERRVLGRSAAVEHRRWCAANAGSRSRS